MVLSHLSACVFLLFKVMCLHMWEGWVSWNSSEGPRQPTLCSGREVPLVGISIHSDITVNSGNGRKWVSCLQISLQVQGRRGWNTKLSYLQLEMSLASDTAQSLDSVVIIGTKLHLTSGSLSSSITSVHPDYRRRHDLAKTRNCAPIKKISFCSNNMAHGL